MLPSLVVPTKDPEKLDAGPLPSFAWAGWNCFDVGWGLKLQRMYRTASLCSTEVYTSCGIYDIKYLLIDGGHLTV